MGTRQNRLIYVLSKTIKKNNKFFRLKIVNFRAEKIAVYIAMARYHNDINNLNFLDTRDICRCHFNSIFIKKFRNTLNVFEKELVYFVKYFLQ